MHFGQQTAIFTSQDDPKTKSVLPQGNRRKVCAPEDGGALPSSEFAELLDAAELKI